MEQILLTYGLSQRTVTAVMIVYKNTKAMIRLLYDDTEFFDIISGVLQDDTLISYLSIICWIMYYKRQQSFRFKNSRNRRYSTVMITHVHSHIDLAVLVNTPVKVNHFCIFGNKKQVALASTWTKIKQRSCVLNQKKPSQFSVAIFWNW